MLIHHKYVLCFYLTLTNSLYLKPKFIRQLRTNEAIFLSSISLLLGYNGPPLRTQSSKTSVQNKDIIIITLMTDLG